MIKTEMESKEIIRKYKKEYYLKNKEKIQERIRQYAFKNKEKIQESQRKKYQKNKHIICIKEKEYRIRNKEYIAFRSIEKLYGINKEEYNNIFEKQNGCCKICGVHQSELKKALCVDHDHNTNIIRGLLCNKCNIVLGLMKDDTLIFKNMIYYLENNDKD